MRLALGLKQLRQHHVINVGGAPANTVFVRSALAGTGDGSSFANAAPFSQLPTLVANATSGSTIALYSGDTFAPSAVLTSSGGTAGNPILIVGMDELFNEGLVTFQSNRGDGTTVWTLPVDPEQVTDVSTWVNKGNDVFKIQCSYLTFRNINFTRCGVCIDFNHTAGSVHDVIIEDCQFTNVRNFIDHNNSSSINACELYNITIRNCSGTGFSKKAIRFRGKDSANFAHDCTVSNCSFNSGRQDGDNFAAGFVLDGYAQDITFDTCSCINCHDSEGGNQADYWNADGASTEETNANPVFTNYTASGNTDGGIDTKVGTTVIGGSISDCKRNMKVWGALENASYHFEGITLGPPNKRGGTGSACHFNVNHGATVKLVEIRAVDMDLRLNGQANAQEIAYIDTSAVAIIKYINCLRDAVPVIANDGPDNRYMIAASAPVGAPALNVSAATIAAGSSASIVISSDRDADYGGVIIRSIGGTDGALFQVDGPFGTLQSISPINPITTAADYPVTLTIEDLAGNQATAPFTITVASAATVYINALTDAGAAPTAAEQTRLNTLFDTLTSDGVLAKLDRLFIFAGETETQALLNAVDTTKTASKGGTPTFTANRGYKGSASGDHIFDANGWTDKYQQDSAFVSAYINSATGSGPLVFIGGTGSNGRVKYNTSTAAVNLAINDGSTTQAAPAQASRLGAYAMVRNGTGLGNKRVFRNGALTVSFDNVAGSMPDGNPCVMRSNTSYNTADQLAYWAMGEALTDTDVTNFYNAMLAYLTDKGAN